ncbi:uncharacterized protein ACA1_098150 [Acanthamoeba castellanii str. Neff]|uniref:Uncharacterized protein n=1 Tax=Acanthamoeba castellanii (strain ATCC 30010 / Neff) TaxID=1257118 RepID=L8GK86_ACACF|nr:uncharacterized protein ACA1_098150 [Acanthamoeba castellanii str. Neff]ELR13118.1 hypothetical protein ACA1_098150 [Acanthamoeba castellanii str. Neff]
MYYWGEAGSSMKVQVRAATKQLCKKSLSTDGTPTDASAKKKEKKRRKLKHSSRSGEEEMVTKKKKKKTKTKKEKKAKKDEAKATGKESGAEEETSSRVSSKKKKRDKKEAKEKKKKEKKEKKREREGTRAARAASEGSESGISSCSSAVSPKETKKKKKKKSKSLISAKKVLKSRSPSDPLPAADGKARSFILNFHHHHRQHKRGPLPPASSGPTRSRSATETVEHRATRKSSIVGLGGLLRRTATADGDSEEPAAASPFFIEEDGCGGLPVADDESGARVPAIPLLALDALTGAMEPSSSSEPPDSATSLPPSPSLPSPGGSLASVVATAATKTKSKRVKAWCKKKGLVDKRRRSGGGLEQYQQLVMTMGVLDGDAGSSTPLRHVIVEGRYAVGLP